jgi:hypothetical protein
VVAIAAGNYSSFAIRSDGSVAQWGTMASASSLTNIIAVAASTDHSLAITADLLITSIALSGRTPVLGFHTFAGREYMLEYASDLSLGDWTNWPTGSVSGNGRDAFVADPSAPLNPTPRFYRLEQLR